MLQWKWASAQTVGQRLAFQILHDEIADAILRADMIELTDIRMPQ